MMCGHHPTKFQVFLTSNTVHELRPTLSITVTRDHIESPGKSIVGDRNDGSRKWKSPESNYPPFSMLYFDKSAYCCYSTISGATTGTSLLLTIAEHTLR